MRNVGFKENNVGNFRNFYAQLNKTRKLLSWISTWLRHHVLLFGYQLPASIHVQGSDSIKSTHRNRPKVLIIQEKPFLFSFSSRVSPSFEYVHTRPSSLDGEYVCQVRWKSFKAFLSYSETKIYHTLIFESIEDRRDYFKMRSVLEGNTHDLFGWDASSLVNFIGLSLN